MSDSQNRLDAILVDAIETVKDIFHELKNIDKRQTALEDKVNKIEKNQKS